MVNLAEKTDTEPGEYLQLLANNYINARYRRLELDMFSLSLLRFITLEFILNRETKTIYGEHKREKESCSLLIPPVPMNSSFAPACC